jgi:AcrR family transcriptional regulator
VPRIAAAGDARRTMRLLWWAGPRADHPRRGPRASLSVERIVDAAIALADETADAGVSLRVVAARLGCTPMALYTYVADRRELLDVMYDRVHAELEPSTRGDWTERTAAWATAMLELYVRHPWVAEVSFARSVLGPHEQRSLELLLDALAPAGLASEDEAAVVSALFGFARSSASTIADARRAASTSDERAWWTERSAALAEAVPDFATRFPRSAALGIGSQASAVAPPATATATGAPWVERATRRGFERAVAMLLAGAIADHAGERRRR